MEKKIIITLNENGTLQIDYPNDISFMETIGVLDSAKAILLDRYVNPKLEVANNENDN